MVGLEGPPEIAFLPTSTVHSPGAPPFSLRRTASLPLTLQLVLDRRVMPLLQAPHTSWHEPTLRAQACSGPRELRSKGAQKLPFTISPGQACWDRADAPAPHPQGL